MPLQTFLATILLLSFSLLSKQRRKAFCQGSAVLFPGVLILPPSHMSQAPGGCLTSLQLENDLLCPSEQQVDKHHLMFFPGTPIHLDGRLQTTPL
jgi:hypothetical protein